jgi:hypothetical protein
MALQNALSSLGALDVLLESIIGHLFVLHKIILTSCGLFFIGGDNGKVSSITDNGRAQAKNRGCRTRHGY